MVGTSWSFGAINGNIYLIKTDSLGNTLWTHTYGGINADWGYCVQQTTDGGYIVVGHTESFGAGLSDIYLIKVNSSGDTLWTRTYGGEFTEIGWAVQQTIDGGYIVTGHTSSFGAGVYDVYLIKTDSTGDTLWTRTYGGSGGDAGWFTQQTIDGEYIVVGETESFGAGYRDVYLIKTNSVGDTLWTRTYGGSDYDHGYSVQQNIDGGYIVVGETESFGVGEQPNVYLIKTDSTGDALWARTYGGNAHDWGNHVRNTTNNGYIVIGVTESFDTNSKKVYLIKTDSLGDPLWSRIFGGIGYDEGWSVQQTMDEGYIVAGWTDSYGFGSEDVMLTKLNALGKTCIGRSVSSTVMSVTCSVTCPPTVITYPATVMTNPLTEVTSPSTEVMIVCEGRGNLCGDTNGEGKVDISDAVYLILYFFKSGGTPQCPEPYTSCADVNGDGEVTISDVVYLINYLLKGGDPPIC